MRGMSGVLKRGKVLAVLAAFAAVPAGACAAESSEARIRLDPRVRERLLSLVEEYCRDPLSRAIFNVRAGKVELGQNMAGNPGFEEVWGDERHKVPDGEEWREGVAHGWGIPPRIWELGGRIDTYEYESEHERFGKRAWRISHRNAYYSRTVSVRPGNSYFVRVYTQLRHIPETNLEKMPEATLQVRWFGRGWIYTDYFSVSRNLSEEGQWEVLELVAIPADGALSAVVFLSVENMEYGAEVLFDNLSFRAIMENN